MRKDAQLALKTRGGVLDHHETVVEVGVLVEERRQLAHQAVEQAVDAAVAHFAQIRDRDAEVVGRHTGIGAVGIAAHQRDRTAVLLIEDERVVDGRVELDSERRLRVIDRKRRERGDGRGAGEQDKAFFGRKHDGLESRALERFCAVKRFALIGGPALADHHHADVALERQIADRAVAGDDGADARVEHVAD